MFRYIMLSSLSVSIAFSNFNLATTSTLVPRTSAYTNTDVKPNINSVAFNPIYHVNPIYPPYPLYPINNTYPTYYPDYTGYDNIYKYKLFEIKNDRLSIIEAIKSSFRSLFYPFERKIPLYAIVYKNNS
jgi:hypothetical protein